MSITDKLLPSLEQSLSKQYPGIRLSQLSPDLKDAQKLALLSHCIQYGIPKEYYPQHIRGYEQLFFSSYLLQTFDQQRPSDRMDSCYDLSINPRTIDAEKENFLTINEEADRKPIKRLGVQEIKAMMNQFSVEKHQNLINSKLFSTMSEFKKGRSETCQVNNMPVVTKKPQKKISDQSQSVQNGGKKDWKKRNERGQKEEKQEMKIELGSRIPLQTQKKRSELKKLAKNNFSVLFSEKFNGLDNIEQLQYQISFLINRVSPQVLEDVVNDLSIFISHEQVLCKYFTKRLIDTCLKSLPDMIRILTQLAAKCTKIPISSFTWEIKKSSSKKKINHFHWLLGQYLQEQFICSLNDIKQKPKQMVALCTTIGSLIHHNKLSKNILIDVFEQLLNSIISSSEPTQYHFEALIALITSLHERYSIFQNLTLERRLSLTLQDKIRQFCKIQDLPSSIIELLTLINNQIQTETDRIKCLLINLNQKVSKGENQQYEFSVKKENYQQNIRKTIHELVASQDPDICELRRIYQSSSDQIRTLQMLIKSIYDAEIKHIPKNIKTIQLVIDCNDENIDNFKLFWQQYIAELYIEECDYPCMIEALSQIILYFSPKNTESYRINLDQDHIDYEDCQFFMNKLFSKLQYHAEVKNV